MSPRTLELHDTAAIPSDQAPTLAPGRWQRGYAPRETVAEVLSQRLDLASTATSRYEPCEPLGRGGMGEVIRSQDLKIGREIAFKTMLPPPAGRQEEASSRFLREARVQALLDHPAIVPVYDIGVTPAGLPYFTMKRVRGDTLFEILEKLREDPSQVKRTRRRLLNAFVTVCHAVHYAHERGVVHRDLKPDNIMLGAHGEVYVLDWGVAKVMPVTSEGAPTPLGEESSDTRPGDLVGTPGYMAPEQALGEGALVDARSDVFALGAILYEILTLKYLIDGEDRAALVSLTLSPTRAAPPPPDDVAPELYLLALRATSFQKDDRCPSAREIADAVERYLDGDRDSGLRKKLADDRAEEARAQARLALEGPEEGREAARARAMRAAGAALAFSPDHPGATRALTKLFTALPDRMPASAEQELDSMLRAQLRHGMRDNALRAAAWIALFPLLLWMGVRSPLLLWLQLGLLVVCLALAVTFYKTGTTHRWARVGLFGCAMAAAACLTFALGPLIFVPGWVAITTMLFTVQANPGDRKTMMLMALASFTIPLGLELAGLFPPSMRVTHDGITLLPRMTHFEEVAVVGALYIVSAASVIVPPLLAIRLRDALVSAEQRLVVQKWHLQQGLGV